MIVIRLPDDVEAKLRESVASEDVATASKLLQDAIPAMIDSIKSDSEATGPGNLPPEELERLLDEIAEANARDMGPNPPEFGPDAFSRDSIYEGHPRF